MDNLNFEKRREKEIGNLIKKRFDTFFKLFVEIEWGRWLI